MGFGNRYNVPLRDRTYEGAKTYFDRALKSRDSSYRYIGPTRNPTYQVNSKGTDYMFRLYRTNVVTYHKDGSVSVSDGGYGSKRQTKNFIDDFVPDWAQPFAPLRARLKLDQGIIFLPEGDLRNLDTLEQRKPGRLAKAKVRKDHKDRIDYTRESIRQGNAICMPHPPKVSRLLSQLYSSHAAQAALELNDWVITPSVPFKHPLGYTCVDGYGNIRKA